MASLVAAVFTLASGWTAGVAALAGGSINVVANFYFARKLFGAGGVSSAAETISRFYVGEFVKLFITVALLALAIGVFKFTFLPLFVSFVATLAIVWLASLPSVEKLLSGGRS